MTDSAPYVNTQFQRDVVYVMEVGSIWEIEGMVTIPAGKVLRFKPGGRITGYGTINGGIIDASPHQHIFEPTLTINPEGVIGSAFSARWFGASPSVGDNQPLIQKAIDTCIQNNISNLYLPRGNYYIAKGLLFYSGPSTHVAISFYGDKKAQTDSSKETWLNCTHADNFCIGIHLGKGVVIENIGINGVNQLNYTQVQAIAASSTYLKNGSRDNQYSPYAGIVFEPFHANVTGSDRYPGFESYYDLITGGGGSTSCIVKDVTISGFTVARVLCPNGTTQNNESHVFERNWISNCREGFASCVSQERTTSIREENIWASVKTCYHTSKYGNLFGDPPMVNMLNIANSIFELVDFNSTGYSPMLRMENIHAEDIYRIGLVKGMALFTNCRFHFIDPTILLDSTHGAQPWILKTEAGSSVCFDMCQLYHNNNISGYPTRFTGFGSYRTAVHFKNTVIGFPSITTDDGAAIGEEAFNNHFSFDNSNIYIFGGQILNISKQTGLFDNSIDIKYSQVPQSGNEIIFGMGTYQGDTSSRYVKHKVTSSLIRTTVPSGAVTVTRVGNKATFDLDDSNELLGIMTVGSAVFTSTLITDQFGESFGGHIGRIESIDGSNIATIHGLIDGFITGSYSLFTAFTQHVNRPFVGDSTSGTDTILNVVSTAGLTVGDRIFSFAGAFPKGAYITIISGTTVTMSKNALATITNDIFSPYAYDESGVTVGVPNDEYYLFPDKQVIRKGTILTVLSSDSPVIEYLCIRSGTYGTANLPQFKPIYKQDDRINITLESDGSTIIPGGLGVEALRIKSTGALAAFKVGTTANGSEVLAATTTTGSPTWDLFQVNAFSTADYTIYFGGITTSTDILIYTI